MEATGTTPPSTTPPSTTQTLIAEVAPLLGAVGSSFYFDRATLQRGKELGLDGFRFYFLGRGGVLGDVEAAVVRSAFGYFEPGVVDKMWTSGRAVISPRDAGREYLECARDFGRQRFAETTGLEAFCEAAISIRDAADPAGLALFAGIAAEPLAEAPPARAMQLAAVLRELRGSVHLLAVIASGLEPRLAHALRRPGDYALFGWQGDPPAGTAADRARLAAADELTDRLLEPAFEALSPDGAAALAAGARAMHAALAPTAAPAR
jgi:hypothetical protein